MLDIHYSQCEALTIKKAVEIMGDKPVMSEDDAFKENIEGFDLTKHVLPVTLTDATEDGGLFGCRF